MNGQPRTLADFKGKVVVVFFGYVQCPDVCPTTLAELAAVKQQLGEAGKEVQSIFVTVDPERDTPEILKAYMGSFGGSDFLACMARRSKPPPPPRNSRSSTPRCRARPRRATPSTTPRAPTSSTARAGCGSSAATVQARKPWRRT
jgi:protein SCO1/2